MIEVRTKRLTAGDRELARTMFARMSSVLGDEPAPSSDSYLDRLLGRDDFWAIAAFVGKDIVGGITAHTLPMTRAETSEVFIYDLAVREDHQRKGVGRTLVTALREAVAAVGIDDVFVAADDEDTHALAFYRALGGIAAPVTIFTWEQAP